MSNSMTNLLKAAPLLWRFPAVGRRLFYAFHVKKPVREVFNAWALAGRDAKMERGHGPVARRLLERMQLPPDAWYLDIGCGNGYTVRWAAARLHQGRAVGIDISPQMLNRARELSTAHPRAEYYEAGFPYHQLPYQSFDAVLSIETLYYLPNLPIALAEIKRLLRPGGIFVSAVDFYLENEESHMWPVWEETRMKLLSARKWRQFFKAAGFTGVQQERLLVPQEDAVERWHMTVGSLVTSGRSPGTGFSP